MRRVIAVSLSILGLLLSTRDLTAQVGSMRVTVPSPTAASLGKFGDIPVSLYTGVPDISIPLFTAKGKTLELPIMLKYHASGIRVEEIAGWVGLGWSLEAGGTITRTVRGIVDESVDGYFHTGHTFYNGANWPTPSSSIVEQIQAGFLDGDPDQFFFSFAGRSGQFVMGPTSTSTSIKEYRAIPYQKLRIEQSGAETSRITSWVITIEDGTRFTFGAAETTTDWTTTNSASGTDGPNYSELHTSAWHLTEMRSPGGDVITLQYAPYTVRHRMGSYREKFDDIRYTETQCVPFQFDVWPEYAITVQRLVSITTVAHTITFSPGSTLRADAFGEPRLDKITVTTPTGTVLRTFQLEHDYFPGNRLRLKNAYEQDRNGASLPPYSFTYDGQTLPERTSYAIDHWGYYNGRTSNTTSIPPGFAPMSGTALGGADRKPDATFMKAGVLTKITYPTGGYNEFVYEANDYGSIGGGGAPVEYGPEQLRDASASQYGPETDTQTFTIGGTDSAVVTVTFGQRPTNCAGGVFPCPYTELVGVGRWLGVDGVRSVTLGPGTYTLRASTEGAWSDDPFEWAMVYISVRWRDRGPVPKKTAGGLRVAEVRTADATGNVTIRKYKYILEKDPTRSSGAVSAEPEYAFQFTSSACSYYSRSSMSKLPLGQGPVVGYSEVTVWHGASGEFGKTRHTFRSALDVQDQALPNGATWPYSRSTTYEWMRGQETGMADLAASGHTQRRTAWTYSFRQDPTTDAVTARRFRGMAIHSFSVLPCCETYFYKAFEVISGWAFQDGDTTIVYDTTGTSSLSTAKAYVYGNPNHIQLTEVRETNSDGAQRITRMKYPADYAAGSGNPEATALTAMQGSAYMHNLVIERWVIKRVTGAPDSVVQAEVTSFRTFAASQYLPYQRFVFNNASGATNFVPSSVPTASGAFTKDGRYVRQETANTYDVTGRITRLTDARGAVTDYAYGGNENNAFLMLVKRWKAAPGGAFLATDLAYDASGYVASIRDEGGSTRYFTYDPFGRLSHIKRYDAPDTVVLQTFAYAHSRTSANGWAFDSVVPNRITTTTYLTPTVTSVVSTEYFDGLGRSRQTVVQDGSSSIVTATEYDAMGRPWRAWSPFRRPGTGYATNFAATATDSANAYHGMSPAKPFAETQYLADALGRISKVIPEHFGASAPFATVTSYSVDAALKHQITEVTDESGKKRRSFADAFGNTVKIILGSTAPESTVTQLFYNILGQRTKATDPRVLHTTYALDTRGLLTSKMSPDAGTVNHKYDQAGNLRYTQDANQAAVGQVSFTTYDFANRPLVSGQAAATFSSLNPFVSQAFEGTNANWLVVRKYDAKPTNVFPWSQFWTQISPLTLTNVTGRLAAVASKSNGAWQVTLFSYDADGHVLKRYTFTQANSGASVLTAVNTTDRFFRDLRGALTQRTLTVGSSAFHHWYDYDSRGLLWKVFNSTSSTKPATPEVTYTYRPSGQVQDRLFAGGTAVPMRYTIRDQLEKVGDPAGTAYPFSARYAYQANGTVDTAEFYSAGSPVQKRYRYVFGPTGYDALNRLKVANYWYWDVSTWTSSPAYKLEGITYDRAGNITALKRYGESGQLLDNLTYAYGTTPPSNRLTGVTELAAATPTVTWDAETGNFTYDANGNMKTAPGPYLITTGAPIIYDHQNLPLAITQSGTTTTYRYNDAGQRITKQVGTGHTEVYLLDGATSLGVFTVDGAGAVVSSYFNVLAGDRVVGRKPSNDSRRYYHTDLLGSTRAVVDRQTGAVLESYDFEPWGLLMPGRTLGSGTKEGFTGKEQDAETGLDYFGARYYMAALGRWAAVDPLADRYSAWSGYVYTLNNPVSLIDPHGLEPCNDTHISGRLTMKCRLEHEDAERRSGFQTSTSSDWPEGGVSAGGNPCDAYPAGACPEWLQQAEAAQQALNEAVIALGAALTALLDWAFNGAPTNLFEAGSGVGQDGGTLTPGEQLTEAAKGLAGLVPVGPVVGTGLRIASPGLKGLFKSGTVRGESIINIRSTLLGSGFRQGLTKNGKGFLFINDAGEQVRIMRSGGAWVIRVRNSAGNYLDEFGNVADPSRTHGISVFSK